MSHAHDWKEDRKTTKTPASAYYNGVGATRLYSVQFCQECNKRREVLVKKP